MMIMIIILSHHNPVAANKYSGSVITLSPPFNINPIENSNALSGHSNTPCIHWTEISPSSTSLELSPTAIVFLLGNASIVWVEPTHAYSSA